MLFTYLTFLGDLKKSSFNIRHFCLKLPPNRYLMMQLLPNLHIWDLGLTWVIGMRQKMYLTQPPPHIFFAVHRA